MQRSCLLLLLSNITPLLLPVEAEQRGSTHSTSMMLTVEAQALKWQHEWGLKCKEAAGRFKGHVLVFVFTWQLTCKILDHFRAFQFGLGVSSLSFFCLKCD